MRKATNVRAKTWWFLVLVAVIVCLNGVPTSAQKSPSGAAAPVLTFTPGLASTVAGTGVGGYAGDGGPAREAQFNSPTGIARDSHGNLYVADIANNVVRMISVDGTVSTIAGNGTQGYSGDGGPAINAQLAYPVAVAVDDNDLLYIADLANFSVRKVDGNGIITTIASVYGSPVRSVTTDSSGNVYFASSYEGVWRVDANGLTTKIAGTGTAGFSGDGGPASEAQVFGVNGLAVDREGNLYLAESINSDVRKIDTNGIITTIAGDQKFGFAGDGGPATSARFNGVMNVTLDAAGNLYIIDASNNVIRKVNGSGTINSIAGDRSFGYTGDGGLASMAGFAGPTAIALDNSGNLLIADTGNNVVREIQVDSTTLDFGSVTVGQTGGPISVVVSNAGGANLNLSNVLAGVSFGVQTTCIAKSPLSPGSDCSVDISFTPVSSGQIMGTATLIGDSAGSPHIINLKGQGRVVPVASQLIFATQFQVVPLNGNLGMVVVNATDASGNLATGFTGVVRLQLGGPAGFTAYSVQGNASNGTVTFNLTSIVLNVVGTYAITASSGGLTSAQAQFTVAGNPDFTISISANTLRVGQSGIGNSTIAVMPSNGFNELISLSCNGLPLHSTCSFLPVSLSADGTNRVLSSTVTISTGVTENSARPHSERFIFDARAGAFTWGLAGLVLVTLVKPRTLQQKKKRRRIRLRILTAVIGCLGLVGCGTIAPGQSHLTPQGSYTVTITGLSTGARHSTTFTLAVH